MKAWTTLFGIVLGLSASIGASQATVITETYNFTLGNFEDLGGSTASPISSISGSFTVTFDPSINYVDQTIGLTVNSLTDTSIDSPLAFSTYSGTPSYMTIGGTNDTVNYIDSGTNDFVLQLKFADANSFGSPTLPKCTDSGYDCGGAPTFYASGYTLADYPEDGWFATTASVSAETPLPAAFPLFLSGIAGTGGLLRWKRKKNQRVH
jgi:hypothetical protein